MKLKQLYAHTKQRNLMRMTRAFFVSNRSLVYSGTTQEMDREVERLFYVQNKQECVDHPKEAFYLIVKRIRNLKIEFVLF